MALEILTAPDPRLQEKALPVEKVNGEIRKFMDQLLDTMYLKNGIGLASTQVGVNKRVIVIDLGERGEAPSKPFLMANPELLWISDTQQTTDEGCLSLPGYYAEVVRPLEAHVSYVDENNQRQHLEASGLLACCIQHEIDHLNGVLFVDHLSFLKRRLILNKLIKDKKRNKDLV
jgi:peptide deformylase